MIYNIKYYIIYKNFNLFFKFPPSNTYWSNLLWNEIFKSKNINGSGIDRYEFYDFCGYFFSKKEADRIFNMINKKSRCILEKEFEEFLEFLDNSDYENIVNSLEIKVIEEKVIEEKVIEEKVIEEKVIEEKAIEEKVTEVKQRDKERDRQRDKQRDK
jgi:hypothetical protein